MQQLQNIKVYQPTRIDPSAQIGEGTKIGAFCDIGKNVVIGKHCIIQAHVTISNECKIGDYVFIGPNTSLLNDKYIDLGDDTLHPVVVKDCAKIGGGCTILPDVTLGENCEVGAGSVVTKDVHRWMLVYGNPAEQVAMVCGSSSISDGKKVK